MADSKDKKKNYEFNKEEYEKAEENKAKDAKLRRKKRRKQRKVFAFIFIILLLLCSILLFLKTPIFEIDKITVNGNSLVSTEDIVAFSGLSFGENIFNHTASYTERCIIKMPYISKVEVTKKYPSEIIINVTEEDIFGAIELFDKKIAFDKFGKSIKEITDEESAEILIFKGLSDETFSLGEYVSFIDQNKTETFIRCLKYIVDYNLENVKLVDIEDTKSIYMIIGKGLKVKIGSLGTEDEFSYKMAYIKEVLLNLPQNVKGVIDATNVESGVYYRTEEENNPEETENEDTEDAEEEKEEENTEKTEENFE